MNKNVKVLTIIAVVTMIILLLPFIITVYATRNFASPDKKLRFLQMYWPLIILNVLSILLCPTTAYIPLDPTLWNLLRGVVPCYILYVIYSFFSPANRFLKHVISVKSLAQELHAVRTTSPRLFMKMECFRRSGKKKLKLTNSLRFPIMIAEWTDISPPVFLPRSPCFFMRLTSRYLLDDASIEIINSYAKVLYNVYSTTSEVCNLTLEYEQPNMHPFSACHYKPKRPAIFNRGVSIIAAILLQGSVYQTLLCRKSVLASCVSMKVLKIQESKVTVNMERSMVLVQEDDFATEFPFKNTVYMRKACKHGNIFKGDYIPAGSSNISAQARLTSLLKVKQLGAGPTSTSTLLLYPPIVSDTPIRVVKKAEPSPVIRSRSSSDVRSDDCSHAMPEATQALHEAEEMSFFTSEDNDDGWVLHEYAHELEDVSNFRYAINSLKEAHADKLKKRVVRLCK